MHIDVCDVQFPGSPEDKKGILDLPIFQFLENDASITGTNVLRNDSETFKNFKEKIIL